MLSLSVRPGSALAENQADKMRPVILEFWKYRIQSNGGVHPWTAHNDGTRVFQEWVALMESARGKPASQKRAVGKALEQYVVGNHIHPLGALGTSVPVPGYDPGDFDMTLLVCSSLLQLYLDDRDLLTDATLEYLVRNVVRTWGQRSKSDFEVFFVSVPETENHVFMIESTRYLTNQLLWENTRRLPGLDRLRDSLVHAGVGLDNARGSLKTLLLQTMHKSMCNGFFEFNAQIYQRFTIHALDNLFTFAHDAALRDGAGCLLDFLAAEFAFQSYDAIRYGPYRRSSETYEDSALVSHDAACSFFAAQSGDFPWPRDPDKGIWHWQTGHSSIALFSTLLGYRIPDPILNFMQRRPAEYRAEVRSAYAGGGTRSRPTEIYYGGSNYLITGGGRYEKYGGPNFPTPSFWFGNAPWVYDVITRSSSVLLNPSVTKPKSVADILHFKGPQWRANNLSLYRRFVYGYAPTMEFNGSQWPQDLPASWTEAGDVVSTRDFDFRFVDRSRDGVYLVLSRLRPTRTWMQWSYQKYCRGTIEVVDTGRVSSIAELREKTLAHNTPSSRWISAWVRFQYTDFQGNRITLNPRYDGDREGIVRVDEAPEAGGGIEIALPFRFPWRGENVTDARPVSLAGFAPESPSRPLFKVELFSPWKGISALSDGSGNMYFYNPATGGYVLSNFREWWNPLRKVVGGLPD